MDDFSPSPGGEWPKALNIHLSFEEALRLQLGLQHALWEMNKMNRSTRAGRRAAVNLCLYPHARRITINPGRMREERP